MSIRTRLWRLVKAEIKNNIVYLIRISNGYGSTRAKARANRTYYDSDKKRRNQYSKATTKIEKYYAALELKKDASHSEVKKAYIKLVKKYHPDKFQDEEKKQLATELLQKINEAYAEINEHLLQTAV